MAHDTRPFGVKAAAQLLCLSEKQIRALADSGALPCTRDHENRRTFAQKDVFDMMRKRQRQSSHQRNDLIALLPPDLRPPASKAKARDK